MLYLDEQEEGYLHSKRVCVKTKLVDIIYESFKIIFQGKIYWIRAKEVTGWIPDFEEENEDDSSSDEEMSNEDILEENGNLNNGSKKEYKYIKKLEVEGDNYGSKENNDGGSSVMKKQSDLNIIKYGSENSVCSGHFKKDFIPKSGGSILQVMEELIKVGQTIGYNMEGCKNNIGEIISSQGSVRRELRWDSLRLGRKINSTISDYLIIIQGEWIPSGKKILIISIYAPRELREKKLLWEYLILAINNWKGEVVIIGDFNEVRSPNERYGYVFNLQGADAFNRFISSAGSKEIPIGGYRFLSDHKPILMRESDHDYDPTLFRFYHFWFEMDGFDNFVEQSWKNAPTCDPNAMVKFSKKLRYLKQRIHIWIKENKLKSNCAKQRLKEDLAHVDVLIDNEEGNSDIFFKRKDLFKSLQDLEKLHSLELAQKTKIKWAIEGDENSKYYHEVLNKNRNQLNIRGVLIDEEWVESPPLIKSEFLSYFTNRFDRPPDYQLHVTTEFPRKLSPDQQSDLEINITRSEIKKANDVVEAVHAFFNHGKFPKGTNSSFITLIPKNQEVKTTKDFRPITLIRSVYKIITKILANRMVVVLEDLVNEVQSAFVLKRQILDGPFISNELYQWCTKKKKQTMIFKVDFEKAYDLIRWDYLDDILNKFGFGEKWRGWIRNCLFSSKGSILVNGSPTMDFQFRIGLKQGDPLSLFLFILIMESLHISVDRVVEARLFRGVQVGNTLHISHLFFADDAVFLSHWSDSNIDTILHILDCFYHASGLKINMSKNKLMGISVHRDNVAKAAQKIGRDILQIPFSYLDGRCKPSLSGVDLLLSNPFLARFPFTTCHCFGFLYRFFIKWNQRPFFNGIAQIETKQTWIKWKNVLVSTQNGGLGVSSLFALNRALLFKWVWRLHTHQSYLWSKVIKGIHGNDGNLGKKVRKHHPSLWLDIIKEVNLLRHRGINLMSFLHRKMGKGEDTYFWDDKWRGDKSFKVSFPHIYALETHNLITVAHKFSHSDLSTSFRRMPRSGIEEAQYNQFKEAVQKVLLIDAKDSCRWSLEGSGEFSVSSTRKFIDDHMLAVVSSKTRWIKEVPIKVNILAWKVKINGLPTRLNISKRGIDIDSILCPLYEKHVESSSRTFFSCHISREIFRKVLRWWQIDETEISCYEERLHWLLNIRLSSNHKKLLEGVCYVLWWHVWQFRSKTIFGPSRPLKAVLFDEVIASSFYWCKHRSKFSFSWIDWIKNAHLISL
nr:RNA-directed DNA polymerase, eukaryota, reverse transcriptase zinc-binding domain protein [Tanacetum cinerariifolium]